MTSPTQTDAMNLDNHLRRRGMLLLMVLSLLTLFLLMGTTFLVLATRARNSARAFMTATSDIDASPAVPRAVLDEALLMLLRGCQEDAPNDGIDPIPGESLLGDMYGADGERRPFLTETWDSPGSDIFMTETVGGAVARPAYGAAGAVPEVDNDADGVLDGVWLQNLFPKMASSSGGMLTFKTSYLVLDLDSRINVNAHGGGSGSPLDGTNPIGPADVNPAALPPFVNGAWMKVMAGGSATGGGAGMRISPGLSPTQEISGRGACSPGGGPAYGLRLGRDASRSATLPKGGGPTFPPNPFTVGELERLLRPFDSDWSTLPPRLAAFLTDLDTSARWLVTTDSWDVTSRIGKAARVAETPTPRFDLTRAGSKAAFAQELYDAIQDVAGPNQATAQWVANVAEHRDPSTAPQAMTVGPCEAVTGVGPADLAGTTGPWSWNGTGGFISVGDLLAIPRGTKAEIEPLISQPPIPAPSALHSLVTSQPRILDAVIVPSRFKDTVATDPSREPGRVNVNTCDLPVWQAVRGGAPVAKPGSQQSLGDLLINVAQGSQDVRFVDRAVANRLAAIATVRSNVFAVWITVEVSSSAPDAGPPTCHRMFAIVDRSIPVLYQKGRNTDVHQVICLKRFLN